ncbi:hypothetical protein [Luteipulveratus halotolerans]|nr:hypothetical protein [Luteipulveratus halotolerans]
MQSGCIVSPDVTPPDASGVAHIASATPSIDSTACVIPSAPAAKYRGTP